MPLPKPRANLRVEEKTVDFMVDIVAQNSVLLRDNGPMTDNKTWVQDATRIKPYFALPKEPWTWEWA